MKHLFAFAALAIAAAPLTAQTTDHFPDDTGTDRLGTAVDGGADIDGDGIPDFVVGGSADDDLATDGGTVRAISGADFSVIFDIDGATSGLGLGGSVACVGDTNGDGFAEFLAGTNAAMGFAFLYSGADGSVLRTHPGTAGTALGVIPVVAAGDVNADGHADYMVGSGVAPFGGNNTTVYSGFDGGVLYTVPGVPRSGGEDVDADGFDDFLVAIVGFSGSPLSLHSGRDGTVLTAIPLPVAGAFMALVGDLNGDGHSEYAHNTQAIASSSTVVVYSGLDHTVLFTIPVGAVGGASTMAGVGDWDGDGRGDIAVRHSTTTSGGPGRVRVLSGVDQSELDRVDGVTPSQTLGTVIASIGDRNGDGQPDYILGSGRGTFGYAVRTSNLAPGFGTATVRGLGCAGGADRQPRIHGGLRPKIGQSYPIRLRGGPLGTSTMGALIYGAPQSLSLATIGLPECTLLVDPFGPPLMITTNALGMFAVALPFPNDMAMLGLALDLQCALSDATAPHALGLSFSDALGLVIGQ